MGSSARAQTARTSAEVAARVRERKEAVLADWEERVRREIPAAARDVHPELINTMPAFLDALADTLDPGHSRRLPSDGNNIPRGHGNERARNTDYSVANLVREYQLLRIVLLEHLDPLELAEVRIITESIDDAIRESLAGFLEATAAAQHDFVSTLMHDLRGPIAAAQIAAQLILRRASPQHDTMLYAARIVENLRRIDRMLTDLLDAGSVRAGNPLHVVLEPAELTSLVEDVVHEMAMQHGPRFNLKLPGERVDGWWSPSAMRRVLENLMRNAVKYGTPEGTITVELHVAHGRARIAVHNPGPPIAPEDLPRLFQAYLRTASARTTSREGWGLGLVLVKGVVDAHGGTINVDSTREHGTIFTVDVPVDARPFQKGPP